MLTWRWFEVVNFPKFSFEVPIDGFLGVTEIISSIIVFALDLEKTAHIDVGLLLALVVVVLVVVDPDRLVVAAVANNDAI